MLFDLMLAAAITSVVATVVAIFPGAVRATALFGAPLSLVVLAASAWLTSWITGQQQLAIGVAIVLLAATVATRALLRGWSWLARLLFTSAMAAFLLYLAYSIAVTVFQAVIPHLLVVVLLGSVLIVVAEIAAMGLALSYLFEILDVLGRRRVPVSPAPAPEGYLPRVAVQVPMYNEPVELVRETLVALSRLDYPNFLVQAVDNNTKDPSVWMPIQQLCQELGERFTFLHLDPWPGFKAGALNEATRQLPADVEVIAIVDADYVVQPGFLRATVGHFADPKVGFVQTPQHYRDWEDDTYLRGLFHSYRYFFDITMPARAHRDAIIFCGTMGLIRRSVLDEIGGWNPDCITEDAEASLRILGRGYRGVYLQQTWGEGLMPLTFDGLKKQRFRWALGGIQILRQHWRELVPLAPHRLRLTRAQRAHYLVGAIQWFGDAMLATFTLLLLGTAVATAAHDRLPVAQITGAVLVIPLLFLVFGLLRAVWALRASGRLTWRDAGAALRVWFALSWTVTLADIRGLLVSRASFLRTPKRREGISSWAQALRSSRFETTLAVAAVLAAAAMEVRAFSFTTSVLAVLLLLQASVYLCAPWASLAAEGIHLTPMRRIYLNSSRSTGNGYQSRSSIAAIPLGLAVAAFASLIIAFTAASPPGPQPFGGGSGAGSLPAVLNPPPAVGVVSKPTPTAVPSPSASPSANPSPSPSASPSVTPSPSASASPSTSASPSPSPSTSPSPSPSPSAKASPTA